jgi:hypothetical protein
LAFARPAFEHGGVFRLRFVFSFIHLLQINRFVAIN